MNFTEAVQALKAGKKIRRTSWAYSKEVYLMISKGYAHDFVYVYNSVPIVRKHVSLYSFQIADTDAVDWELTNGLQ